MVKSTNDNDLHRLMVKEGRLVTRAKGQIIQTSEAQKCLNLIHTGYIKRYIINNDGSLGVDLIYGPGDIFSLTLVYKALFGQTILDSPETYYYEAIVNTEFYALRAEDLVKHVEKDPMLYRDLLSEAGKRLTAETHGLENVTMKNSYRRVAHQIAFYGHRFGQKTGTSVKLGLPLTHQDLADSLSLTRETVSTCMVQLRKKGLITSNRFILIPNISKLEEEAFS